VLSTATVSDPRGPRRIPSLDGLRALSISLVILSHLLGTRGFPLGERALGAAGDIGYLGVRVFFVISGYLITSLLLKEHGKTGTVSLGGFYTRRAFRIFPAFYAFILAMAVADIAGAVMLNQRDVLHALTYTMNYHYVRSWELGHIWSLSIEEQFYMLWPALFLLARPKYIGWVAAAMVVVAPALRLAAWFWMPYRDDVIMEAYPCVMDSIAAGCVLAVVQGRLAKIGWYQRFLESPWFWLMPVVVFFVNMPHGVFLDYIIDVSLMNLGITVIVDRVTRVERGPSFALLNWAPLAWVGTLSYSLYLWQEPFLNHRAHTTFTAWPLNLGLAILCAIASYYLVERPFFTLRDEWARRRAAKKAASPSSP
jgi:peptidoglycan/LPS O-acetylase OafA/YrhL